MNCSWGEFHLTDKEVIIAILYVILEWWLGRTTKTRAASVLDLIFVSLLALFVWIGTLLRKKDSDGK